MIIQTTQNEANGIIEKIMNRNHFLQLALIDSISQIRRILTWDSIDTKTRDKLDRTLNVLKDALEDKR